MKFSKLESVMADHGVNTLAEIARFLETTPQAVSNWKARDQVPFHIVDKVRSLLNNNKDHGITGIIEKGILKNEKINFSDLLLILAEQIKVIFVVLFISVFFTITHIQFIKQPLYLSTSKILLSQQNVAPSGISGIASQFGVNFNQMSTTDLSSPSLFPDLIKSRIFAKRILEKSFYSEKHNKSLSLLAIFTHGTDDPIFGQDTLIHQASGKLQSVIKLDKQGPFSELTVELDEPRFARELNRAILDELQSLNRFFKMQSTTEKISFIQNRIKSVSLDLEIYEQQLRSFREKNRQISSPALQLEEERLLRDVDIQKNLFITLKQQLELAKIEEVQGSSVVQILDEPTLPIGPSNKNLNPSLILSVVIGLLLGILLGFLRSYINSDDIDERRKFRRIKNFIKKKTKDVVLDRRISGIISLILIIGLPYWLGHRSQDPVFFNLYSAKLMFIISFYLISLLFFLFVYIKLSKQQKIKSN